MLTGIITESRLLRDAGDLEGFEVALLEETYDWLNAHLPCPPFAKSGWPKDVVSWFKADATLHIKRMWDLVAILGEHGVQTRLLTSTGPGKVLYEDAFQVVVEEWRRLNTTRCRPIRSR